MIPYTFYKVIHLAGIFMTLISLGGLCLVAINGSFPVAKPARKRGAITHGIGVTLIILGGFGMAARLAIPWPFPLWLWLKLVIWLALAGALGIALRKPKFASALWWLILALGTGAAYLGIYHPFEQL
jgi:hypothetical protein